MLQTVVNHNNAENRAKGNQFVLVTGKATVDASKVTTMPKKVPTGNRYSITVSMDDNGLVKSIAVSDPIS